MFISLEPFDEVFGEENFIAEIIFRKTTGHYGTDFIQKQRLIYFGLERHRIKLNSDAFQRKANGDGSQISIMYEDKIWKECHG